MRYANKKQMIANGHKTRTIHHGATWPGCALFNLLPQYHSAAIQICCEPCTTHARKIQTSAAAPYKEVLGMCVQKTLNYVQPLHRNSDRRK